MWVDTECSFTALSGSTFAEGCVGQWYYDSDEEFAEVAEDLARAGIPITARCEADLHDREPVRDPDDVFHEFRDAEFEKRA